MSSNLSIQIVVPPAAATVKDRLNLRNGNIDGPQSFAHLGNYMSAIGGGTYIGSANVEVGSVPATGTIVFTSTAATNTETMTLAGVTITAVTSSSPTNNQFTVSTTPATAASNLVKCINASTSLAGIVTASIGATTATVLVTSVIPGVIGNGLVMANVNLANTTVTSFASGSNGTVYTFAVGL